MSYPVTMVPRAWLLDRLAGPLMGTGLTEDQALTLAATELAKAEDDADKMVYAAIQETFNLPEAPDAP